MHVTRDLGAFFVMESEIFYDINGNFFYAVEIIL